MNALAKIADAFTLPAIVDRAARALAAAKTSAEILEAREMASVAYDAAKRAARMEKAKGAHDALIAAAHRAQADALEIEAGAKRRLADEYDAAQERGEVAKAGDNQHNKQVVPNGNDLGLSRKIIHEAREIRDAEKADPGIVRRTLDEALDEGEEPTRAKVKRAVKAKRRHRGSRMTAPVQTQHDRDLQMLLGVWGAACESAREEFLDTVTQ